MKKTLSVLLAVLMIFSALSIGVSATGEYYGSPWHGEEGSDYPAYPDQRVLEFNLNGGTMKYAVPVYDFDGKGFIPVEGVTGTWAMVPQDHHSMKVGYWVSLPVVTPPAGQQFSGWYCYEDHQTYGAGGSYMIRDTVVNDYGDYGQSHTYVYHFTALYTPAVVEKDTMTTVLGILTKVFGTIYAVLTGMAPADGIAFIESLLGGIIG